MCDEQKVVFDDPDDHAKKGGLKAMSDSLARGHVLVMSLWDDHDVNMLWLDSNYPLDRDPSEPGVSRGPCSTDSGEPSDMESNYPNAQVKFSKIRVRMWTNVHIFSQNINLTTSFEHKVCMAITQNQLYQVIKNHLINQFSLTINFLCQSTFFVNQLDSLFAQLLTFKKF